MCQHKMMGSSTGRGAVVGAEELAPLRAVAGRMSLVTLQTQFDRVNNGLRALGLEGGRLVADN